MPCSRQSGVRRSAARRTTGSTTPACTSPSTASRGCSACDHVVVCAGQESVRSLYDELRAAGARLGRRRCRRRRRARREAGHQAGHRGRRRALTRAVTTVVRCEMVVTGRSDSHSAPDYPLGWPHDPRLHRRRGPPRAVLKWGMAEPDVIPAWVAEMDYALAPPVAEALAEAVAGGVTGYPPLRGRRRAGEGVRRVRGAALRPGRGPGAGVPGGRRDRRGAVGARRARGPGAHGDAGPAYSPAARRRARLTGRERVDLPLDPDADAGRDRPRPPRPAVRRRCAHAAAHPAAQPAGGGSSPAPSSRASATWCSATAPG